MRLEGESAREPAELGLMSHAPHRGGSGGLPVDIIKDD